MAVCVMVIDDSLVIRKILEICLRRAGYEVESFPDGVEALRWLNTGDGRLPHLIVVDLSLPKLDGYAVIRLLKARPDLEHVTLVILSQRDGVLDRIKGRLVGADAYLTKPFKTDQLVAVIQASLGNAVPHVEQAKRPASHQLISSEATACPPTSRSLSPFPGTASRGVENEERESRRMGPVHGHTGEPQ